MSSFKEIAISIAATTTARVYTQALTTDALGADASIAAVAARTRRVARATVQRAQPPPCSS